MDPFRGEKELGGKRGVEIEREVELEDGPRSDNSVYVRRSGRPGQQHRMVGTNAFHGGGGK